MSIFDDIKRDREAGTPGPWCIPPRPIFGDYCGSYVPTDWDGCGRLAVFHVTAGPKHAAPNARRISRAPQLERIALAAEALARLLSEPVRSDDGLYDFDQDSVDGALAAFREAAE